ncbi:MAG: hypothetical protein M3Y08_19080 [Fibrobacterota bacterium]|nr:hypothetical protein [Fibrobacterota bacterium]
MAEKAFEASREEDNLDWNSLSSPVPLDLIDSKLPSHPEAQPSMRESTLEMPARTPTPVPAPIAAQDEYGTIRSKLEVEAEAEKKSKLEAEKEEASQQERLEQWMTNARTRLLKADADLTGPSGRIRKESSPSLHRLVEMQKTMWVEGEATQAESPNAIFNKEAKAKSQKQPLDPMATICVPTEQFLTLDAPAQPTMRERALASQTHQQAIAPPAKSPAGNGQDTDFQPMTREQALTRKVAQLRRAAEGGDNTLAIAPSEKQTEGSALHFAIAAVVLIAIGVLGLGLFAATQAGLFDGLENRVPFLRPEVSAKPIPPPAKPPAPASKPASVSSTLGAPPGNQPPPSKPIAAPSAGLRPAPTRPAIVPSATIKAQRVPAKAGEIPAYDKVPSKASNLGEIMLRASIQAAANIDTDNLNQLYNHYALGFPGLSGEVVIGLMVDPVGRILEGNVVNSTTGADAFDQELLRKVMGWQLRPFPESHPKFITVPFLFPLQGR